MPATAKLIAKAYNIKIIQHKENKPANQGMFVSLEDDHDPCACTDALHQVTIVFFHHLILNQMKYTIQH